MRVRIPAMVLGLLLVVAFASSGTVDTNAAVDRPPNRPGANPPAQLEEGTVVGHPSLAVVATDNRFEWGQRRDLTLTISNAGTLTRGGPERFEERVTTARNVRIEVATDRLDGQLKRNLEVRQGATLVGAIGRGQATSRNVSLGVSADIRSGTYEIPLRITYDYTRFVRFGNTEPEYNDATTTEFVRIPIVVEQQPRLEVRPAGNTTVRTEETTFYTFRVTNTGSEAARNVGLVLLADNTSIHFGGKLTIGSSTAVFVDRLEPGESRTIAVTLGAFASTAPGTYLVRVQARYETPSGFEETATVRFGVPVVRSSIPSAPPPVSCVRDAIVRADAVLTRE